jgi:CheY-like chemotaxis protein
VRHGRGRTPQKQPGPKRRSPWRLRIEGHEVETAFDGPAALAAATRFRPDLALLDVGLPVMDGYELARRLRERDPGLRLFAVTGYGQPEDRARVAQAGFDAHFVKPVDLVALKSAVLGGDEALPSADLVI